MAKSVVKRRVFILSMLLGIGAASAEPQQVVLDVPGMNCSVCPVTVKKALQRVPGFLDAQVDLDTKRAVVRYDAKATPDRLAGAVTKAGFPATVVHK
jgi:periplasmic mercuric ion binding protein